MTQVHIPKSEHGVIRVFAVSRPMPDMSAALKSQSKEALAADLLGRDVGPSTIELFPVTDLTGVGLPRYLADGYDVPDDQLRADRARLDALDGYVLLVFSSAFGGAETTLNLPADLTLIGTYGEASPDMHAGHIDSDAAKAYSGTPTLTPPIPPKDRAGSLMVGMGLLVAVLLLLFWIVL